MHVGKVFSQISLGPNACGSSLLPDQPGSQCTWVKSSPRSACVPMHVGKVFSPISLGLNSCG
ncbi:hypothetical protein DPMN_175626 [Dreissena polymorpha]|uniref:Uncharacterized protein n=1 Tax=Dreissena polymorpha TaxID=45954 RepID=A0A9D4E884_DREPO|nr:hypothetical protein DPMN_175626 [Dreissena polymorpha]